MTGSRRHRLCMVPGGRRKVPDRIEGTLASLATACTLMAGAYGESRMNATFLHVTQGSRCGDIFGC